MLTMFADEEFAAPVVTRDDRPVSMVLLFGGPGGIPVTKTVSCFPLFSALCFPLKEITVATPPFSLGIGHVPTLLRTYLKVHFITSFGIFVSKDKH